MPDKQRQLSNLENEYGKVKAEEKKSWDIIIDLNKLYKVDRILLKQAYQAYPKKAQLQKSNEYKLIEKFYRYTFDNLQEIERKYLSADNLGGQENSTYLINKNSTSKFVRDENEHYQRIFNKYAQKIYEDNYGINALRMSKFIKQCFQTQYTEIIQDGNRYFENDREEQMKAIISEYYLNVKEIQKDKFLIGDAWLEEQQVLDFLSFWLKSLDGQDFYVLYCRTEQKLKKQIQYLKNQAHNKKKKIHPKALDIENSLREESFGEKIVQNKSQQQQKKNEIKQVKYNESILQKYRKNKVTQEDLIVKEIIAKEPLTKKQQFDMALPEIFDLGCKRRYPLPSGRTFDQIENQTKTMNMEKFINFCRHFQIVQYLSKELLLEYFKIYALNRRILDLQRFKIIMSRMIESDQRIIDRFLQKNKRNKPKKDKFNSIQISSYKYTLRPVNGKDVESIEYELKQKKMMKSKSKEERMSIFYAKKKESKKNKFEKRERSELSSYAFPQKTNILELENMRDDKFDPQMFIGNDKDDLLNIYESKLYGKQKNNTLEIALSKRIEKGQKIINKITNKSIKQYN